MKKWMLSIPLLVLLVTLFLIFKYLSLQKSSKSDRVTTPTENVQVSLVGKDTVEAKSGIAKIINWDPDGGSLKVQNNDENEFTIEIDPSNMKVLIPYMEKDKRGSFMILDKVGGIAWKTAFSKDEEVNILTDESGKIISVISIGQRKCGSI
jgi:preprotein translocase subunit YajC